MSVASLATTLVNVYEVTVSQDIFGANTESYSLKYKSIPVRIRYMKGRKSFYDGKEQDPSIYRIYFPFYQDIIESDLVIDINRNRKYDVLYNYKFDKKHHMQVDTKYVDSILGDFCPNTIKSITASILVGAQAVTFNSYSTVEQNSTNTKNHFIPTYTFSTVGKTASDKTFFGEQNTSSKTLESWQEIWVNNNQYFMPVYRGTATSDCCVDLIGAKI